MAWTDNAPNRDMAGRETRQSRQIALGKRMNGRSGPDHPNTLHGGAISFQGGIQLPDAESALQEILPLRRHARAGLLST
jgi:hypothetical protein